MFGLVVFGVKKIGSILKKTLLVVVVFSVVIGLFIYFIQKDRLNYTSKDQVQLNREHIYKIINDPQTNKTTQGKISIAMYRLTLCGLIGEACTNIQSDGNTNYPKSIFGFVGSSILFPYTNPPASGVKSIAMSLQNAGFIPQSYASEGIGFGSIQAFGNIWKAFRDVAYMIMVIILIAIGFMIMFRTKLNPQTVISIENSLPNIVIALILITFSFAIAGFLIDFMYVLIALIISILSKPGGYDIVQKNAQILNAGPDQILNGLMANSLSHIWSLPDNLIGMFGEVGNVIHILLTTILNVVWVAPGLYQIANHFCDGLFPSITVGPLVATATFAWLKTIFGFPLSAATAVLLGFIITALIIQLFIILLVFISIFVVFLRILFILITSYLKIILYIILAPLFLLAGTIPGQQAFSFSAWIKNLFAELLTFPVVVFIFLVGSIIVQIGSSKQPILLPPFLNGVPNDIYTYLIGMGLLLLTPDLIKLFRQLIIPKPLPFPDVGPGVFFGGAKTGLESGIGELSKYAGLGYYMPAIGGLLNKVTGGMIREPQGGPNPNQHCLPSYAMIDTPFGEKRVTELQVGDPIWSVDEFGIQKPAVILLTNKHAVSPTHQMLKTTFEDGRILTASPSHPLLNYQDFDSLVETEGYNNSYVTKIEKFNYKEEFTYDILPSGSTGTYWANKVLIGSTLKK